MNRIKSVKFQDSNHRYGDKEAIATMTDGSEEFLFPWFSDEYNDGLPFRKTEFIGLTLEQALEFKTSCDITYLRS